MRASALAMASLALVACSNQENIASPETSRSPSSEPQEPTPLTPDPAPLETSPAPSLEMNSCTAIQAPVFPGSRFNQANADSIQKQLDALEIAKTPGAEVGARTVFNANAIITNALGDNIYAEAMSAANASAAGAPPSATELLSRQWPVPESDCLTRTQLQQVDGLYRTLVAGLGPQVGRQLSAAGQVAYDSLQRSYQQFQERYQEELATR